LITINGFLTFYKDRILSWDILEVEVTHRLDCGDFDFAFTVDALIREDGRVKVIDWKFIYEFLRGYLCTAPSTNSKIYWSIKRH
jgi:hypothetical protein